MDNIKKKDAELKSKNPIPINVTKLKKASVFDNIKLILSIILITLILIIIGAYYIYSTPFTSVIIEANSSVNLKLNRWNKVVKISALDTNGSTILADSNLKYKSIDDALIIIINKAEANDFIKSASEEKRSSVTIYISGNSLNLPNFYNEAKNKTYDVQINENGIEKYNNFKKNTSD